MQPLVPVHQPHGDDDACLYHPPDIALGRGQLFKAGGKVVEAARNHRHLGRRDLRRDHPAFGSARDDELERRKILTQRQDGHYVARAFDMDHQRHRPGDNRHQRLRIHPVEQRILRASVIAGRRLGIILHLAQHRPEGQDRGGTAAARILGPLLAQFDILEGARPGDGVHVRAKIHHRALPGENADAGRGDDDGAGNARRAADRDRVGERVDRRSDIDRGGKGRPRTGVIGFVDRRHLYQTDAGVSRHQTRRHPFAARINGLDARRNGDARASGRHLAGADQNSAVADGFGAVADGEGRAGDGEGLGKRGGGEQRKSREGCASASRLRSKRTDVGCRHHFTSPAPIWPSSKSLTGRSLGLALS